jgi:hypothetical protein
MNQHPEPEQLSAYVDGELSGSDRDDLEQHLTGCSDCSATVRAIRATLADMRALPAPVPSEQDSWRVRAAITKARRKPAQRYRAWVAGASVAAAVIAIVVITNGRTASSTFSHTGNVVAGEGTAAAPAPTMPPIEIYSTDFSLNSAPSLLARSVAGSVGSYAPKGATPMAAVPGPVNTTVATEDSRIATYTSQIRNCESSIFGSSRPAPYRYVVATYEKTPAFFMVYAIGDKLELYVVQRKDCYIRDFIPPR